MKDGADNPLKLAIAFGISVYWLMILVLKLSDIANTNLDKLLDRANRGKLSGSGDNR